MVKFVQLILEFALFGLTALESVWIIQLNETARVPSRLLFGLLGITTMLVVIVVLEFVEMYKVHQKIKKLKVDRDNEVAKVKSEYEEKIRQLSVQSEKTNSEDDEKQSSQ